VSFLVVDGHSVIYQIPGLLQIHQRKPAQARELLTRQLSQLHDTSHWRITLVFDGKTGPPSKVEPGKMHVIYSQTNQTADSVIERLVQSAPDSSLVTVVTADQAERLTVESFGATVWHPAQLEIEMDTVDRDWQHTLKQINRDAKW